MSVSFNNDPDTGFQPNPTVDITADVSPPNASPTIGETSKSKDDQKPSDQANLDYVLTIMDIPIPTLQVPKPR